MRQGNSSNKENRLKKQKRLEKKYNNEYPFYYKMIQRRPSEKNKRFYSKLVNYETASKLINGVPEFVNGTLVGIKKLSRTFTEKEIKRNVT